MKNHRLWSRITVLLAYIVAIVVGVVVFSYLKTYSDWLGLLLADIASTFVIYLMSLLVDNASLYDPYWSVQPMIIVPFYLMHLGNFSYYYIVLLILIELWGLRLTLNWYKGFINLSTQDWRYTQIKAKTKKLYPLVNLLGIQMMPTLIVYSCLLPFIMAANRNLLSTRGSIIASIICLLGIALEYLADTQKQTFRKKNNGIVNIGLWKKGRHPNYFGEILMWWGVYLYVVSSDITLWWTIIGTLINTCLFLFISIPLAERQTQRRHPEEYEEYIKTTRKFI